MHHLVIVSLLLVAAAAPETDDRARKLAEGVLNEGAALFDTRDAPAMAATYAADAEIVLIGKDADAGSYKPSPVRGRSAIEQFYRDVFKDRPQGAKSRNDVASARFLGSRLLLVEGKFTPDVAKGDSIPFVQVRARDGDRWMLVSLQLILVAEDDR